jgi:hypothetical protein
MLFMILDKKDINRKIYVQLSLQGRNNLILTLISYSTKYLITQSFINNIQSKIKKSYSFLTIISLKYSASLH